MKKIFLIIIILLLQSFPSFGEWKEIGKTEYSTHFLEGDTIRVKGNLIYFNSLIDFFEPQQTDNSFLSQMKRNVIDCKNSLLLPLRIINYKRSMGRGKIVLELDSSGMNPLKISKESFLYPFKKILCEDKR
jgi:hypothetical protein